MDTEDSFSHLQQAPADPILGVAQAYKASTNSQKINLGVGAYRDEQGKPYVFQCVRTAEQDLLKENLDKEYLPIEGLATFRDASQKLIFGDQNPLVKDKKICTVQALSGTGSLRVGFEFLAKHRPGSGVVYVSKPTWANHISIIQNSGLKVQEYPYWDPQTKGLDFNGMIQSLNQAPEKSIVLLHVCAHNPTGVDPTPEQWREISKVIKNKQHFTFFDSAYQGFASGDLVKDAVSVKIFQDEGLQFCLAQSFAKNFGLYGERVGALHFVCKSKDVADKLMSQIKLVIRPMYSNPPIHGAQIVSRILNSPQLRQQWETELKMVSQRIIEMRQLLKQELAASGSTLNWDHITNQIGMFSYTGLNQKECEMLTDKYHIFLVKNGRISMAGINRNNVKYLAQSIQAVQQASSKL